LRQAGYSNQSATKQLFLAAHVSRWLDDRDIELREFTEERIGKFIAHRRRRGYRAFLTRSALVPLIDHLRREDIVPFAPASAKTALDRLFVEYESYLVGGGGLLLTTIRNYEWIVRRFVAAVFKDSPLRWRHVHPSDIHEFIVGMKEQPISCRRLAPTALRSWFRFLRATGRVSRDLAAAVPIAATWNMAWLPTPLLPAQLENLLKLHDVTTAIGCRDAAIVRLMFRLGLRLGEVAALKLDDIDWRAGEVIIKGKMRREGRLPMPPDVGNAIARYLTKARPPVAERRIFLRSRAPLVALTRIGIVNVVIRGLRRIGVMKGGSHLLRQTAATELLRRGASLSEVAHVLRHGSTNTTAIYTKVDHSALRTLARRWAGGAA
jgi:site-specific recombinase XerD